MKDGIIMLIKVKKCKKKEREVDDMGVMAKPVINLPIIDKDKSKRFIRESNQQKLSDSFLKRCQKSAELFKRDF